MLELFSIRVRQSLWTHWCHQLECIIAIFIWWHGQSLAPLVWEVHAHYWRVYTTKQQKKLSMGHYINQTENDSTKILLEEVKNKRSKYIKLWNENCQYIIFNKTFSVQNIRPRNTKALWKIVYLLRGKYSSSIPTRVSPLPVVKTNKKYPQL